MLITRRSLLAAPAGLSLAQGAGIESVHAEIWRRFIDHRWFTMYDYADLNGEVILPTAADCGKGSPNALAWWTPIENGAFFGGLYLEALVRRAERLKTAGAREQARNLAGGLVRLASVASTSGFIARGVIADGRTHYAAGSDDQSFPWFYGLWWYAKSSLPGRIERREVIALLVRTAHAIEELGWRMPCDRDYQTRGEWTGNNFIHAGRLLFVLRAMHDLTGDRRWLDLYRRMGASRLEFCARGCSYQPPGSTDRYPDNPPFWTSASSQGAIRVLLDLEDSAEFREAFRTGLNANAKGALQHVRLFRSFENSDTTAFTNDWRFLHEYWKPQPTIEEAVKLGSAQVSEWHRRSPRRVYEAKFMREPLFAAWVVSLAEDRDLVSGNRDMILSVLSHYNVYRLHTSLFFIAGNIWEQYSGR